MVKISQVLEQTGCGLEEPIPPPIESKQPPRDDYDGNGWFKPSRTPSEELAKHFHPRLVSLSAPNSFEAKQIDMLRTQLLFPSDEAPPRIFMIASSAPREGRSLLAANLAIAFARGLDKYVLVVDCNLTNPSMHELLNVPRSPGLTNFLEKDAVVPEIIHHTLIDKLSVIPAGVTSNLPTEILSTKKMMQLIDELRERYSDRYIILDTSPVLASDDTAIISRLTEAIVFVVKSGGINREKVLRSLKNLPHEKLAGLVMNDQKNTVWDVSSIRDARVG